MQRRWAAMSGGQLAVFLPAEECERSRRDVVRSETRPLLFLASSPPMQGKSRVVVATALARTASSAQGSCDLSGERAKPVMVVLSFLGPSQRR